MSKSIKALSISLKTVMHHILINKMFSYIDMMPKLYLVVFFFSTNKILFTAAENHGTFSCFQHVSFIFFTHHRVVNNHGEHTTISLL